MFARGGLHFEEEGKTAIRIRSGGGGSRLIVELPLQAAHGRLRSDVKERLGRGSPEFDDETHVLFGDAVAKNGVALSRLGQWELDLMTAKSPPEVVEKLARLIENQAQGGAPLRLVRLLSTDRLFRRLFLLELIDGLLAGMSLGDLRKRARGGWVSGLIELQPQAIVCPPLVARNQPLAAALMTPYLMAVVAMPADGGGFMREVDMSAWPTGMAALRLGGPGKGVYTGLKTIPSGHAQRMLSMYVDAANHTLEHLTAPERWIDQNGDFDSDERRMAWISVRIGLDAIASVGAEWSSRQAIWEAFRALSVLAGFWGDRPLAEVLTPDLIREHAVARIPDQAEKKYASAIVDTYEQTINKAFGANAPEKVAQIRNLVHGVARRAQDRTLRLRVLYELEENSPDLQLVQDIATLWWQAVLLSPATLGRPGRPPW
jgi:hypothetical protein